jgi:putative nucleotidyltransferase with HDIG domain
MTENPPQRSLRRKFLYTLLLLISAVVALAALLIPTISRAISPPPQAGEIATQDYRSPEAITYISDVLTEQRQAAAERTITPIYTSPNTSIARQQLERIRSTLAYISSVRSDDYADTSQKLEDLAALENIHLTQETATTILGLTESRWQAIQKEAILVLERTMSNAIRPENLDDARSRVPAQVSLSMPEEQAAIVAELASNFVEPNSEYSEVLTETARQAARESVDPVNRSLAVGQTIVLRGQLLSEADIEALEQLRLIQPEPQWQNLVSASALVVLLAIFMAFYLSRQKKLFVPDARGIALLALLFVITLTSARLTIPTHTVLPYAFPFAAYSLTVAALFGAELAMITSLPLAILIAFGLPNALDLTLYYLIGSFLGVLVLGRARRMVSFFRAGAVVAISGAVIILIYRLPLPTTDLIGLATLVGAALLNGLASASIALLLNFFLAQFMGMTTPMQLNDLTRPDHPLLQVLLHDAPGTYQHSLQVANLAEQAAESIGADPLLTKVGALYHDVGKTINPIFFIENQVPGLPNPHDGVDPFTSSATIIRHVTDGIDLAHEYRLPHRIIDFIPEHHGTSITRFQYTKAVTAAGGDQTRVDEEQFRYPGPRPQSRETAIVMLADGCEARVRAEKPINEEELRYMVKDSIEDRVAHGQLDDVDITLRELNIIRDNFSKTLKSVYHPRVKYPDLDTGNGESIDPTVPEDNQHQETDVPVDMSVDTPSSSVS